MGPSSTSWSHVPTWAPASAGRRQRKTVSLRGAQRRLPFADRRRRAAPRPRAVCSANLRQPTDDMQSPPLRQTPVSSTDDALDGSLHPRKFSNPLTGEIVLTHPQPLLVLTRSVTGNGSQVMLADRCGHGGVQQEGIAMTVANDCHSRSTTKHHFGRSLAYVGNGTRQAHSRTAAAGGR